MKATKFMIGTTLVSALGCGKHPDTISGSYVGFGKSEFSVANDTLVIESLTVGKSYNITEKIGYQRIVNGKKLSKNYDTKTWQALWDESKGLLLEGEYGKQIYFDRNLKTISIGGMKFKKIN